MSRKSTTSRTSGTPDSPKSLGLHTGTDNECIANYQNRIQTQFRAGVFEGLTDDELHTIKQWFLQKVKFGPKCWLWTGQIDPQGYGTCNLKLHGKRSNYRAHRVAWELFRGESIPDGKVCCHVCDVRPCVRWTDHLFIGSHGDNVRDASQKGHLHVPRNRGLTLAQRLEIYYAPRDRATGAALALKFGVSKTAISLTRKGRFLGCPGDAHLSQSPLDRVFERVDSVQLPVRGEIG